MKKPEQTRQVNTQGNLGKSETAKVAGDVFIYNEPMTLAAFATKLNKPAPEIIKFLFLNKKMVTMNAMLDDETIGLVCLHYGLDFKKEKVVAAENIEEYVMEDDASSLEERPPVVTIMGHVDHGKTTLIDAIRSSKIAEGEFGGISQAIGAYQREFKGKKITFIDTPGHAAFTAMRSRGAKVTDIVILVVAADDGVMPQTKEAIDHAKAADVPIIVAINKMDKPTANPKKVKDALMKLDIIAEEFGGEHIFVEVSAKTKTGIDTLLENILLVAEVKELKANPNRYASGTVLEAVLDKREGPKATLLIENGTLNASDYLVVGSVFGKVRRMTNEYHKALKLAAPSTPVEVIGLSEVPVAGDSFMAFPNEKEAKDIASKRQLAKTEISRHAGNANSIEALTEKLNAGDLSTINLIIKTDNTGSLEAIKASLEKLSADGVKLKIIRTDIGGITENDVMLAASSKALIYGFNIRPDAAIQQKANEVKVDIRLHRIIYALLEEVEAMMKGQVKIKMKENVLGQFEIRQIFKLTKVGVVAGGMVTSGMIINQAQLRLLRSGAIVYEGKISSLKRLKDEVKEVKMGFECGIAIENFQDMKVGDIIEAFEMVEDKA
ncbi:MAG: translation initiation factor IF-2 [Bacilli bacterium]